MRRAMVLDRPLTALRAADLPDPRPAAGQVLVRVRTSGVCRTDLHVVDGDLPDLPSSSRRRRPPEAGWRVTW